jgi:uncharacterized membrane protein
MITNKKQNIWLHVCLLGLWLIVGTALRFINLESKPPWADEWATLVFSLGHSFLTVPLDRLISLDTLLLPVQLDSTTQAGDAIANLMKESTHPPVYFVLTHWWLDLFDRPEGLVSLWWARSLSALLGVVSIPAMFGLGWLLCRTFIAGQIAAALMAVSPYGIYLAQEARHYTLVILWVIISLACLIISLRHLQQQSKPPIGIILLWVLINSLGVATHYFVGLTLVAESLVLLYFWLQDIPNNGKVLFSPPWQRIAIAIIGSLVGCSVWLFTWRDIPDSKLTEWVHHGNLWGLEFIEPIGRLCGWIISMLFLLPIEGTTLPVTIISGILMLITLVWLVVIFYKVAGYKLILNISQRRRGFQAAPAGGADSPSRGAEERKRGRIDRNNLVSVFILVAIGLVLLFTYILDTDLTQAARFQFFYFPAIILAIASVFARIWQAKQAKQIFLLGQKNIVILTLIMGFFGGLTVINNFAYQKPDRPDLVVSTMAKIQQQNNSQIPLVIATVHKTHEQTGEMMGLAWEWEHRKDRVSIAPQFLLLHKDRDATVVTRNLHQFSTQLPRPFSLWLINFSAPETVEEQNCNAETDKYKSPGYSYRLYHCKKVE